MNPMHTTAVAPVIWKASHMLGTKFAAKYMTARRRIVMETNLRLSEANGVALWKRRPSKLSRSEKKITGKYKHDMQRVAHSDSIIEYRTIWNINIRIKICQHVIKGGFSKEKEGKEACSNVDSRAEG